MTRSQTLRNRFFVCGDYSVYYRQVQQLRWDVQTSSGYSLLAVLSGTLRFSTNDKDGELTESHALIVEPNIDLHLSGRDVEFLFLVMSSSLVIQHAVTMRLVPSRSTVVFRLEPIEVGRALRNALYGFTSELSDENPGREIVMRALVEQTIVELLRSYAETRHSEELELSRVGLIDRRIRRSVELMHTQLDQDLSLRDLAGASYLSPFHFARLFKKLTGATPHNYLARIRSERAQLLLAESDLSINEIARRVGYLSASHFTRSFRAATGTTPREFRKALVH
jgi:AraC-like DNA-binding protein